MTELYDLAVIGGGPAGSAAAITARRAGAKVLLVDRSRFPRQKVCGEFVSSEALGLLRNLLSHEFGTRLFESSVSIASARIFLDGQVVTARVRPAANSIPRFDMDHALWHSAAEIGAHVHEQTIVQSIEGDGPFELRTNNGSYSARGIVNATGRWSNLANVGVPTGSKWIGVKAHFAEDKPPQSVDLYFSPAGYCGVQPVSAAAVNVCAMVRADVASSLPEVFNCETRLRERSVGWKQLTETVSTSPLIFRDPAPLDGNVLMAGDAAGFIDPFVGDGISMALHSGSMAASSLIRFFDGSRSLQVAAQDYADLYRRKLLPAFRNAARIRKIVSAPLVLRSAALAAMSFPRLAEFLLNKTRARTR
ncbi:MAG: dependent oxidoreductase [Acidobacteriaceae bacterium]|nr:dependent oxidoreductase [Acidobacteriaceae bacterium]